MRLLVEAAQGKLRHCPRCGATAYGPPFSDFGDPRDDWKDRYARSIRTPNVDLNTLSTDWSEPRTIPWLSPDHPNFYVTSQREAIRVCRDWGIDPERGGFISEEHRARAQEAARRNRPAALAKLTPAQRAAFVASRRRSAGKKS